MRIVNPSRANFLFWFLFVSFASATGALLFFSESLFLGRAGVKASLMEEAKKLKGMAPEARTKNVGRILKGYLDASKHTSRAVVRVSEATADRLSLDVRLPWAEVSAKKRRQRAELVCRLGGDLLAGAGAKDAVFLVNIVRMRKDATGGEHVGAMRYSASDKECIWKE